MLSWKCLVDAEPDTATSSALATEGFWAAVSESLMMFPLNRDKRLALTDLMCANWARQEVNSPGLVIKCKIHAGNYFRRHFRHLLMPALGHALLIRSAAMRLSHDYKFHEQYYANTAILQAQHKQGFVMLTFHDQSPSLNNLRSDPTSLTC